MMRKLRKSDLKNRPQILAEINRFPDVLWEIEVSKGKHMKIFANGKLVSVLSRGTDISIRTTNNGRSRIRRAGREGSAR